MKTADLSFEEYLKEEKAEETALDPSSKNIFERIANPSTDFLIGSQLLEDDEALAKAQEAGNLRAQAYGCNIKWRGTTGTVYRGNKIIETTEIHGAAWDRTQKIAYGLRMDLSLSKTYDEGGSA